MAELKRNFSGGKMNKDMDERVLEPGQYRDAKNVQLATSDGSNVGSLQTLLGNTHKTPNVVSDDYSSCVGILPLPEKDLIYYFVAAGGTKNFVPIKKKDYIIEYDTNTGLTKYVFVDIYSVTHTLATDITSAMYFDIDTGNQSYYNLGIRVGMKLSGTLNDPNGSGVNNVGISRNFNTVVTDIERLGVPSGNNNVDRYRIYHSGSSNLLANGSPFYASAGDVITFTADRVLKFQHHRMITAINHLDGMIFWTDNYNEPRKIHIERSKLGTCGNDPVGGYVANTKFTLQTTANSIPQPLSQNNDDYHTRLLRKRTDVANSFEVCLNRDETQAINVEEADITVIKRNPVAPLDVEMSTTESYRKNEVNGVESENQIFSTIVGLNLGNTTSNPPEHLEVGDLVNFDTQNDVDYRVGDVIMLTSDLNLAADNFALDKVEARIKITQTTVNVFGNGYAQPSTGTFEAEIQSIDLENAPTIASDFLSRLEQRKPMFEFKFPRFSYRYKYTDGEYSTFAPWSEIAFLPGDFDYLPKKGFNLGMTNRVRNIRLKNYFGEFSLVPDDILEVDLLYKESGSKTCYSVKTIKRTDKEWPDMKADPKARGCFELDTEVIYAALPSNQLLRPYDNVPRCAKAQEITANRLVYGNYKQNYNITKGLKLHVQHSAKLVPESGISDYEIPLRSLKSMRTYQVGVVWIDDFGRESPVMVPASGGEITVEKKDAVKQNRLKVKILEKSNGGYDPPSWARYLKYYIKETSNEYYNMAMDRFYDAEDGNVWISFPSAERNKVQEDTYLILKKQHGSNTAVTESARYKVIAISNEAPLYIKKRRKSFGMSTVAFRTTGLPEEGRNFILVDTSDFNDFFQNVVDPEVKDNLQLRIGGIDGGQVFTTTYYDIVGINRGSNDTRITIETPLTDEAAPISVLNPANQMRIEIVENKFEDKPEFDGRFFVKILKDLTLQNELIASFTERIDYNVIDTMNWGYLNDHSGSDDNFWLKWRQNHNGGHQSEKSRWFIDDQDTEGMDTREINRGGMYNAEITSSSASSQPNLGQSLANGNGFVDLSYANFDPAVGVSADQGARFSTPWSRLSVPGTTFRFKQDPAQIVYRIERIQGRLGTTTGGSAGIGGRTRMWKNSYINGSWKKDGNPPPFIGGSWDYAWNWDNNSTDKNNQRWSVRIMVDKQWGGGSNHIWRDGMAPMSKPDPTAPGGVRMLVDGDRYDGAIIGGSFTDPIDGGTVTYPVGHNHNWYPFTSDTGAQLNTANQIEAAPTFPISSAQNFGTGNSNKSPLHFHLGTSAPNSMQPLDSDCNPRGTTWRNTCLGLGGGSNENDPASLIVEFLEPVLFSEQVDGPGAFSSNNPAIWETEPKEDIDMDIYYEASGCIPINPDHTENELLLPIGSTFRWPDNDTGTVYEVTAVNSYDAHPEVSVVTVSPNLATSFPHNQYAYFTRYDNSKICLISNQPGGTAAAAGQPYIHFITGDNAIDLQTFVSKADSAPHHNPFVLGWHNCYSFGNGVESDRIRDDFNAKRIDNGVKASTTTAEPYAEEHRQNGFIWSGIFNSTSGVNNLNQFIQAEPITKDLNPSYGSIQKMVARDTNTLAFCEDKVLKILTNKDALFNADGNSNVTSTNNVLGQSVPLPGEYGISTNPESLTPDPDGFYWCDQMRGHVLTLRGDQIVSISDMGMKDYFNDNLKGLESVVGSYDEKKKEYNISLKKKNNAAQFRYTGVTLSFSQLTGGWVSFKDYLPEAGLSLNNEYYTFRHGSIWQHHSNETRNNFYGTQYTSDVTLIFNDAPGSVKSFGSINYEGTAAAVTTFTTESATNAAGTTANYTDGQYYTLFAKTGWYVEDITTNLQDTGLLEFKNKEGKYFSTIRGKTTELTNLDEREFSVQGLGNSSSSTVTGDPPGVTYKIYVQGTHSNDGGNGPASSSHSSWDSTLDDPNWRVLFKQPLNGVGGSTIAAGSRESYITNEQSFNGSQWVPGYSGLNLSAQDFSVPGGVASTSGTGNATIYKYTKPNSGSWNADPDITEVQFSNVNIDANFNETPGIPGDPANKVKIETFYQSFTMPSGNKVLKHDVDFGGQSPPTGGILRDVCVRVSYSEIPSGSVTNGNDRVTIAHTDLSDFTETADTNYLSDPMTTIKHTGTVTEGQTTMVAKYTVTADSNYYLTNMGGGQATGCEASFFAHLVSQPWSNAYSFNYINTYHSGANSNKIASTVIEILYTPPTGSGWEAGDPDSREGGFCAFLHEVRLDYLARPLSTVSSEPKASTLIATPKNVDSGSSTRIKINANQAGNIGLVVEKPVEGSNNLYGTITKSTDSEGLDTFTTSWAAAESPVVNTTVLEKGPNVIDLTLQAAASSTAVTYNVYGTDLGGDNLDLGSTFPTSSSPYVITAQTSISTSITATLITNMANETGFTNVITKAFTGKRSSNIESQTKFVDFRVKATTGSFTITRQPNSLDIIGGDISLPTLIDNASGATNITFASANIDALAVGMKVIGEGVANNTTISSINSNTVVFSNALTADISQGTNILFSNDFDYTQDLQVSLTSTTQARITGRIICSKLGSTGGNITIKTGNFLTIG